MEQDKKLKLSFGNNRKSKNWLPVETTWSAFCEKLRIPVTGTETQAEYRKLSKAKQDDLKDVGGFVGGTFLNARRKASEIQGRDLITLDLDNLSAGDTGRVIGDVKALGCAAAIYSTRKHCPERPRLRVILPLDRTATPDEYEPAARKAAECIGIARCDPTTFEASRLMYFPSVSKDAEYIYEVIDGPMLALDGLLQQYTDWKDMRSWPRVPGEETAERHKLAKQEDPTAKTGIIGAFCREYTVPDAMDKFLPGEYLPTDDPTRYTYAGGSTTGGAIIYQDGLFLYSHHATDPCSGRLVNAFDLVRLHKFNNKDAEVDPSTPINRLPSFEAMTKLALADAAVTHRLAQERMDNAKDVFSDGQTPPAADNYDWMQDLEIDSKGSLKKTINNLVLILKNDGRLKDKIVTDEFAGCGLVTGRMPWNPRDERRRWSDADDDGCLWYMETYYGIASRDKQSAALSIIGGQNTINEVRDYLQGLTWDGVKRLDTLFSDYLGAADTAYTRAVARKSLCAAVARAMFAGTKYDYMPILTGPQGIGKSTLLAILGKDWFSDSLATFEGKDAAEMLQGTWINEIGELTAMSKKDTNAVKQFLSKRSDIYRAAYGRRTEEHPRQCVFFGTSNDSEFLKDMTGNRRFWPVDVGLHLPKKDVWKDLPGEVDQIWAEAKAYWQIGEKLYMDGELAALAAEAQEDHREVSGLEGLIYDFLKTEVPENWDHMDIQARRMYLNGNTRVENKRPLDKVCALEIWVECLGNPPGRIDKRDSREINAILEHAEGWQRMDTVRRFGPYGKQRGYKKLATFSATL